MCSTSEWIERALLQYSKANRTAVENFCWTATDSSSNGWNIDYDAKMYKWNSDTVNAIRFVLRSENKL